MPESTGRDVLPLNEMIVGIPEPTETWPGSTAQSTIHIVDHYNGIEGVTQYDASIHTTDGLHPNLLGDEILAANWWGTLEGVLAETVQAKRDEPVDVAELEVAGPVVVNPDDLLPAVDEPADQTWWPRGEEVADGESPVVHPQPVAPASEVVEAEVVEPEVVEPEVVEPEVVDSELVEPPLLADPELVEPEVAMEEPPPADEPTNEEDLEAVEDPELAPEVVEPTAPEVVDAPEIAPEEPVPAPTTPEVVGSVDSEEVVELDPEPTHEVVEPNEPVEDPTAELPLEEPEVAAPPVEPEPEPEVSTPDPIEPDPTTPTPDAELDPAPETDPVLPPDPTPEDPSAPLPDEAENEEVVTTPDPEPIIPLETPTDPEPVVDEPSLPVISISTDNSMIIEGDVGQVRITRTGDLTTRLIVSLDSTGDAMRYGDYWHTRSVVIPADVDEVVISMLTFFDVHEAEPDEDVTLSIVADSERFAVAGDSSLLFTIRDAAFMAIAIEEEQAPEEQVQEELPA